MRTKLDPYSPTTRVREILGRAPTDADDGRRVYDPLLGKVYELARRVPRVLSTRQVAREVVELRLRLAKLERDVFGG